MQQNSTKISNGVMLNVYPDSIGEKFSDSIAMLKMPDFKDVFSFIYVLYVLSNDSKKRCPFFIDEQYI